MNETTILWARSHYERSRMNLIQQCIEYVRSNEADYDALQAEWANISRALGWAVEMESPAVVEWVNSLGGFLLHRSYLDEGLQFADRITPVAQRRCRQAPGQERFVYELATLQAMRVGFLLLKGDSEGAGTVLKEIVEIEELAQHQVIMGSFKALTGVIAEKQGNNPLALSSYQETMTAAETMAFWPLVSYMMFVTADLMAQRGEFEQAIALYRQKLEVDRKAGDVSGIIDSLIGLGHVADYAQLPEVAAEQYQEALAVAQSHASPATQPEILRKLANHAYVREDYERAATYNEQALALARRTGDKMAVASTLLFLAFAREELGADVTDLIRESLRISQEIEDYDGMVMAMIQLGDVYLVKEDNTRAREQYLAAAAVATRIRNHPLTAAAWLKAGELALTEESWPEAEHYYGLGLAAQQRFDDPSSRAMILRGLGQAYFMQGKLNEARTVLQESGDLYLQLEEWESHGECLYELACVIAQDGQPVEAEALAQRSFDLLAAISSPGAEVVGAALENLRHARAEQAALERSLNDAQ